MRSRNVTALLHHRPQDLSWVEVVGLCVSSLLSWYLLLVHVAHNAIHLNVCIHEFMTQHLKSSSFKERKARWQIASRQGRRGKGLKGGETEQAWRALNFLLLIKHHSKWQLWCLKNYLCAPLLDRERARRSPRRVEQSWQSCRFFWQMWSCVRWIPLRGAYNAHPSRALLTSLSLQNHKTMMVKLKHCTKTAGCLLLAPFFRWLQNPDMLWLSSDYFLDAGIFSIIIIEYKRVKAAWLTPSREITPICHKRCQSRSDRKISSWMAHRLLGTCYAVRNSCTVTC